MAKPHTIAVAGKGGVGKTTTCGMIIDYLCNKKNGPVLVHIQGRGQCLLGDPLLFPQFL